MDSMRAVLMMLGVVIHSAQIFNRTIQQPRIQMRKPEMGRDGFGNRPLARGGGAINGDCDAHETCVVMSG